MLKPSCAQFIWPSGTTTKIDEAGKKRRIGGGLCSSIIIFVVLLCITGKEECASTINTSRSSSAKEIGLHDNKNHYSSISSKYTLITVILYLYVRITDNNNIGKERRLI